MGVPKSLDIRGASRSRELGSQIDREESVKIMEGGAGEEGLRSKGTCSMTGRFRSGVMREQPGQGVFICVCMFHVACNESSAKA